VGAARKRIQPYSGCGGRQAAWMEEGKPQNDLESRGFRYFNFTGYTFADLPLFWISLGVLDSSGRLCPANILEL
jgi:hypothetical protein